MHTPQWIDAAVRIEDSDRSKFIRNAIREKLEKHGIRETEDSAASLAISNSSSKASAKRRAKCAGATTSPRSTLTGGQHERQR